MGKLFNLSHISAGFTAVLVGYTSSVLIIIQAATAAGATTEQIESWLLTLGLVMAITSAGYSWYYKMPVLTAWSTPGAAMLVVSADQYQLPMTLGACIISGALITLTGLIKPLSRAIARIPFQLGTAMLAAILLPFCLKAFTPASNMPLGFISILVSFLLAKHFIPRYSMLILLVCGVIYALLNGSLTNLDSQFNVVQPQLVMPVFDPAAMINLALPMYLLTMLSQNLPGIAMMKSYQYRTPVQPVLIGTGICNMLTAPFGGFSVNLAAISAAICMTSDVDPDKARRYHAVLWAALFYLLAGLFAGSVVAIFLALPSEISQILAGFALLGTLMMCLHIAFSDEHCREAALLTFLLTLSGIDVLGISATLWGLVVGAVYLRLKRQEN